MQHQCVEGIEKIIASMECPKGFKCYESGLETLCKAKDVGLEALLRCLEEAPQMCKCSIPFGRSYYCKCPIRRYISRVLGK